MKDVSFVMMRRVVDSFDSEEGIAIPIDVGDTVECMELTGPGSKNKCIVAATGDTPGTFNVRVPGMSGIFPNIPVSRLHKDAYQVSELAKVQPTEAPKTK